MTNTSNLRLLLVLALCASSIYPSSCLTRWFSYSFTDLKETVRRFSYCVDGLEPIHPEARQFQDLSQKIRYFLDQGNYDNEQLSNVTQLMDAICRPGSDTIYNISPSINVTRYSFKDNRCRSIDTSMDAIYGVFKRSAYNRSEPLDFSSVQFYANPKDKSTSYNLTDLINTSWIQSEFQLENICKITNSVKEYVSQRISNSTAQDRSHQQSSGSIIGTLMDLIDRMLEPILGLQRRVVWVGSNSLEQIGNGVSHQVGNFASLVGKGVKGVRNIVTSPFQRAAQNATVAMNSTTTNSTVGGLERSRLNARDMVVNPSQRAAQDTTVARNPIAMTNSTLGSQERTSLNDGIQALKMTNNSIAGSLEISRLNDTIHTLNSTNNH